MKGVLVDVEGSTYTLRTIEEASGDEISGVLVTDLLDPKLGGTGTDLVVNVDRVQFAWTGGADSSISLVPEVNTYNDWSSPLYELNGNQIYGQAKNSNGKAPAASPSNTLVKSIAMTIPADPLKLEG